MVEKNRLLQRGIELEHSFHSPGLISDVNCYVDAATFFFLTPLKTKPPGWGGPDPGAVSNEENVITIIFPHLNAA